MSDFQPPADPTAALPHPAPPPGWKPISAMAVVSFILSLVLVLIAVGGLWITELLPLGLGIYTLVTLKTGKKRGRLLAIWAVVIAVSAGSCSFYVHHSGRTVFRGIGESLLTAFSATTGGEVQEKALKAWSWPEAVEADPELIKHWQERYAAVVEAYGPWTGEVELPSVFLGFMPVLLPPDNVEEVATGEDMPTWFPSAVVWLRPVFERGTVHMAIVLQKGDESARTAAGQLNPEKPAPVLGDVRFFRDK